MRPVTFTMGPFSAAPSATAICLAQQPAAAGKLILNGATATGPTPVAYLDAPRNVLITTVANESSRTFTLVGTDWRGDPISEQVQGVNAGTVSSIYSYATITSVSISGPAAGAISVGTALPVISLPVRTDDYGGQVLYYSITANGAVNYTVQQSYDDPNSPTNPVPATQVNWQPSSVAALVGASTTEQGAYGLVPPYLRVIFNSGTGSLSATFLQQPG